MVQRTACMVAVVALVLASAPPLWSKESIAEGPFELHQHHLVVTKGSIGQLNDLSLLMDTGTIPSVADARIAQATPANRVIGARCVRTTGAGPERGCGRIPSRPPGVRPVPVGVGDLSYLRHGRIDALVGLDVLARRSFSIDYQRRVLRFGPSSREDSVAPLELVWPFLTVRMTIAGQPVRLLVDTGSSDVVLFKSRMPLSLSRPRWTGDKTVQYASGPARLRGLELRHAGLEAHTWDKLPAWVLDRVPHGYPPSLDAVLGVLALGCERVQFDFERNELGWSR